MTDLRTPDPEAERRKAKQAQQAYDLYLQDYLAERMSEIAEAFRAAKPTDVDDLVRLKYEFDAVMRLETAVQQDILTGTKLQPNNGKDHD